MKNKKIMAVILATVLLVGGIIGGTLAWLTANSDTVVNTFTSSNIKIELDEKTGTEYKMIPGWTVEKDPFVTVIEGSEDCYLFIKVEESGANVTVNNKNYTFDDFVVYAIDENNWTQLVDGNDDPVEGVYYTYALDINENREIKILGPGSYTDPMGTETVSADDITIEWDGNQVATKPSVTKEMMDAVERDPSNRPVLNFTAYAVQYYKSNNTAFDAYEAWTRIASN